MPAAEVLRFAVPGQAKSQGSMRRGNRGQVIHAPGVIEHRHKVTLCAAEVWGGRRPLMGPVAVHLVAVVPRPKAHYGTGRNEGMVKPSAPRWAGVWPDSDKVARLVLDALDDAGVYGDDRQVVVLRVEKRYQVDTGDVPRTEVQVWALDAEEVG